MRVIDADRVAEALSWDRVITLLTEALRSGRTGVAPARRSIPVDRGELLTMPAVGDDHFGVKLLSIGDGSDGNPRVQGGFMLFSQSTGAPLAVLDAAALTLRRTAGMSAVAALALSAEAGHVTVFGSGPQARAHVEALAACGLLRSVTIRGRTAGSAQRLRDDLRASGFAADADERALGSSSIVVCATTAREPLFDSAELGPSATVLAVGSHDPAAREVDTALARDAFTVVDGLAAASREAGDVIVAAEEAGRPVVDSDLGAVVRGETARPPDGRALYKSVGEGWQDLVVAAPFSSPEPRTGYRARQSTLPGRST